MEINQSILGYSPEVHGLQGLLLVSIKNQWGSASIADSWTITTSAVPNAIIPPTQIPQRMGLVFLGRKSIRGSPIHGTEAIYNKALTPIVPGAKVAGWLRFVIPGVTLSELPTYYAKGVTWSVHCRDVQGGEVTAIVTMTGKESGMGYYPGTEPAVTPR